MTSTFTVRDGVEVKINVNVLRNGVSEQACFLELGSCVFSPLVNALDGDSLYSRSDPSDLDVVGIDVQLPLYDHDSHSDSSRSEEDDLKLCLSYSNTTDIELNLETHETLNRSLRTRKELTGIHLRWNVVPGVQNVKNSPCMLFAEGVT